MPLLQDKRKKHKEKKRKKTNTKERRKNWKIVKNFRPITGQIRNRDVYTKKNFTYKDWRNTIFKLNKIETGKNTYKFKPGDLNH